MSRRVVHAFRVAARPTIGVLIVFSFIFVTRWSKFVDDPMAAVAVFAGLVVVVFLTYFVLALTGFKASPHGAVSVPRVYVWSLICAIALLVFGVLFYFLLHGR